MLMNVIHHSIKIYFSTIPVQNFPEYFLGETTYLEFLISKHKIQTEAEHTI